MNQKADNSNKATPAIHGDELDVLEAVYQLEKNTNKKILTDEQRKVLFKARNHLQDNTEKIIQEEKVENASLSDLMIYSLRKAVENLLLYGYDYCSIEEWEGKNKELKSKVISLFFALIYGAREEDVRQKIDSKKLTTNKVENTINTNVVERVYNIVKSLVSSTDKIRLQNYSDEAWNGYNEEEKQFAREQMFEKTYGLNPKNFGFLLYESLAGVK